MNDQLQQKVLNNLITLYQSRGLSPEKLFQNPIFVNLPIDQKIAIIKKYGEQHSVNGTHWDKEDTKKLLLGLGLGALAIAVGAHARAGWIENSVEYGGRFFTNRLLDAAPQILSVVGAGGMALSKIEDARQNNLRKIRFGNLNTNDDNAIINYLARVK